MPTCAAVGGRNGRSGKKTEKALSSGTRALPTRTAHTSSPTPLTANSPRSRVGCAGTGSADPRAQKRVTPQRDRLCQIQPNDGGHPTASSAPHLGYSQADSVHPQDVNTLLPLRRTQSPDTVLPLMYPSPPNSSPIETAALWQQRPRDKGSLPATTTKITSTRADPATARHSAPNVSAGCAVFHPQQQQQHSPYSCSTTPSQPPLGQVHPLTPPQDRTSNASPSGYTRQFLSESARAKPTDMMTFVRTADMLSPSMNGGRRGRSPSPITGYVYSPRKRESNSSMQNVLSHYAQSPLHEKSVSDGARPSGVRANHEMSPQQDNCFTFMLVEQPSLHSADAPRCVLSQSPTVSTADGVEGVEGAKRPPAPLSSAHHDPPFAAVQKSAAIPAVLRTTRPQQAAMQPPPFKPQQAAPKSSQPKKPLVSNNSSIGAKKSLVAPLAAQSGGTPPCAPLTVSEDAKKLKERRRRELYAWNAELKKQKETVYTEDAV